jgi:hypothetical protein
MTCYPMTNDSERHSALSRTTTSDFLEDGEVSGSSQNLQASVEAEAWRQLVAHRSLKLSYSPNICPRGP